MQSNNLMRLMPNWVGVSLLLITAILLESCGSDTATPVSNATSVTSSNNISASAAATTGNVSGAVRLGYFPNLTHSQALVGIANATYTNSLGKNVKFEAKAF